jgi:hypothetical protein
MNPKQQLEQQGVEMRRVEYDDQTELVADLGPAGESSVELVDETVIAVVGDEQYEVELAGDAGVFMSNGVLTIEVDR